MQITAEDVAFETRYSYIFCYVHLRSQMGKYAGFSSQESWS